MEPIPEHFVSIQIHMPPEVLARLLEADESSSVTERLDDVYDTEPPNSTRPSLRSRRTPSRRTGDRTR